MSVKWTKDQLKVIQTRNCNILVSAAAGSGKTAVLVERIVQRITDKENPVDIDKMLIVTFTNAAAAEMRERITDSLEQKKKENPEDELLDRQLTLIHHAQIATIDSFCLFVVRNHFEEIGIDPNFRIADAGELALLEEEVLDKVFENNYEKKSAPFLQLVDSYSSRGKDAVVREMVQNIYRHAGSASWPKEWIENLSAFYRMDSPEAFLHSSFVQEIVQTAKAKIHDARELLQNAHSLAAQSEGMEKVVPFLEEEIHSFDGIEEVETFGDLQNLMEKVRFQRYPTVKEAVNKERVKGLRDTAKTLITDGVIRKYLTLDFGELFLQVKRLEPVVEELTRLSLEYYSAVQEEKKSKKIVDFSDIEHYALQIFVDEQTKEVTTTAREYRKHYVEIMIDEYQDSNRIQEDILTAISGVDENRNNMFMVGDVKQSIYRFRMARPELFMSKYKNYGTSTEDGNLRIDLHKNFRSREDVLDFTNDIFYKIMQEDFGGVRYDAMAALYPGAEYPKDSSMNTEILLYDEQTESEETDETEELSGQQLEASLVVARIRELMKNGKVTDKESKELRPVRYSDIVILLRGLTGLGEVLNQTLSDAGIPVHMQSKSGYFSAYEVQVLIDFLTILDNPYQDIPMAAVLKSPMVGLSDEELAEYAGGEETFSARVLHAMKEEDSPLYSFGILYERLRQMAKDTSIYKLLLAILNETGFLDYVTCMPSGQQRKANVEMLLEKAIAYEKTSFRGLFHFVRYIRKIRKYDLDGEADIVGEGSETVRIMTIHKSKGLEFPIVFVCGIHKKFNEQESHSPLVVHDSLGIGIHEAAVEPRIKRKCLLRDEIYERIKQESRGEELRVLYVAMTRAKEKLILTGVVSNREKLAEKAMGNAIPFEPVSYTQRSEANSYLKWIYPALLSYEGQDKNYKLQWMGPEDLVVVQAHRMAEQNLDYEKLMYQIRHTEADMTEELERAFSYEYPYLSEAGRKTKYSVSELKHKAMVMNFDREEEGLETPDFILQEKDAYIPSFAGDERESFDTPVVNPGALRGTAVHRVMECLDFKKIPEAADSAGFVDAQLEAMLSDGRITTEMYGLVSKAKLCTFVESKVAQRMAEADAKGLLFREKPFVMMHENGYLVQGIIDVFWFEGDNRIVLLDYKTDRVTKPEELVLRYKTQLDLYKDALQRVFSTEEKTVTAEESLIYSFALEEVINV